MAELDTTNPLAVVVAFFALTITGMMVIVKGAMVGGIIGLFAGLAVFAKIMWVK